MLKIKPISFLFLLFAFQIGWSQTIEIEGRVVSKLEVENIHVINKTSQFFTTTNIKGLFNIPVKLNDTVVFSSIQHKLKEVIINEEIISTKICLVELNELINELDEVTIGKILTGDLIKDINNVEGDPPINFYDVGIPGYKGKKATQSERRLYEAGEFKPKMLLGLLGGGMPLNPILNGISGRTKKLKERVRLEGDDALLHTIKRRLSKDFFASNPLDEELRTDFFYFCTDDKNFNKRCKNKSDFEILAFLRYKYKQYTGNLKSKTD